MVVILYTPIFYYYHRVYYCVEINECAAFEVRQKAFVAEHDAFISLAWLAWQH